MAWEARLGLKPGRGHEFSRLDLGLNGLGSPFGIETVETSIDGGASWQG